MPRVSRGSGPNRGSGARGKGARVANKNVAKDAAIPASRRGRKPAGLPEISKVKNVRKWEKKWVTYRDLSMYVYAWVPADSGSQVDHMGDQNNAYDSSSSTKDHNSDQDKLNDSIMQINKLKISQSERNPGDQRDHMSNEDPEEHYKPIMEGYDFPKIHLHQNNIPSSEDEITNATDTFEMEASTYLDYPSQSRQVTRVNFSSMDLSKEMETYHSTPRLIQDLDNHESFFFS